MSQSLSRGSSAKSVRSASPAGVFQLMSGDHNTADVGYKFAVLELPRRDPVSPPLLDQAVAHALVFREKPRQPLVPRREPLALLRLQPDARGNAGPMPVRIKSFAFHRLAL